MGLALGRAQSYGRAVLPRRPSLRPTVANNANNGVAAAFLAGLATLGGVYVTLGVTNVFDETARNHAAVFGTAAVSAVLAVLCGLFGGYAENARTERVWFVGGVTLLTAKSPLGDPRSEACVGR
jgi:hypothetical protein